MKKNFIFLICFLFFYSSLHAYSTNPKDFISELVGESIETLSNKDLTKTEKFLFIEKVALENVDIKALSLYTLGEIRKTLDKQDVSKYQEAFKNEANYERKHVQRQAWTVAVL